MKVLTKNILIRPVFFILIFHISCLSTTLTIENDYRETHKIKKVTDTKTGLHFIIPSKWSIYDNGITKRGVRYIHLKRDNFTNSVIAENCFNENKNLYNFAFKRMSNIILALKKIGFQTASRRMDIVRYLKKSVKIKKSAVVIAYDYINKQNSKKYTTISYFMKRATNIVNITFETTPDKYLIIKKEIRLIMFSLQ